MENLGLLAALGAALCWGTYAVPFKRSRSDDFIQFQFLTGLGVLLTGLAISILGNYPLSFNLYGIVSGIIWSLATLLFYISILRLGISRSVPLIVSIVILATFLWGVIFFNELPSGMITGLIGIGAIILGIILINTTKSTKAEKDKKGLLLAILSGILYGSHLVPIKITSLPVVDFYFPISLGIFLGGLTIFIAGKGKLGKQLITPGLLSGIIWNIGNLLGLTSVSLIGLSKGIPITQSSVLIAVLWGLLYFKEVKEWKARFKILLGAVILLIGIFILSRA